jgi:BatD DUF11 like domain
MNRNDLHKTIFSLLLLFGVFGAGAQDKTTVKASVDRNKILIGEPVRLTLEVDVPENEPIRFFIIDSIEHFEFLQVTKIDSSNTTTGTKLTRVIPLTSFDSGHWVIPSFVLAGNIATDSIPVDVSFSAFDPNQDYHDIKDIIEVIPEKKKPWWQWYAAGGGLLLLILLIYLLRKKKGRPALVHQAIINPYEEAMKQLEKLTKEKPGTKEYYSALADIFRLYVSRKNGIHSLQNTTDDFVVQLKDIALDKEQFNSLSQALRLSDFVKFAKYIPAVEDDRNTFETIKKSIMTIEKSESGSPSLGGS